MPNFCWKVIFPEEQAPTNQVSQKESEKGESFMSQSCSLFFFSLSLSHFLVNYIRILLRSRRFGVWWNYRTEHLINFKICNKWVEWQLYGLILVFSHFYSCQALHFIKGPVSRGVYHPLRPGMEVGVFILQVYSVPPLNLCRISASYSPYSLKDRWPNKWDIFFRWPLPHIHKRTPTRTINQKLKAARSVHVTSRRRRKKRDVCRFGWDDKSERVLKF